MAGESDFNLKDIPAHDLGDANRLRPLVGRARAVRAWADAALADDYDAQPDRLETLAAQVRQVAAQRWPAERQRHGRWHDVVMRERQAPLWVRFAQAVAGRAERLDLELRPTEADDAPPLDIVDDARVAVALGYLSDRFAEAPKLDQIAAAVHTSPFHFHRLFTRTVGITPKQYMLRLQLQIARRMLHATERPIGQIAVANGFASHGHFTATFRRHAGMSPSAYRATMASPNRPTRDR